MKRLLTQLGMIGALATVASCLEIGSPDLSKDCGGGAYYGSFRGRATGLLSDTLTGCAYFMIDATTGSFSMVFTDGGPLSVTPRIQMVRAAMPRAPVVIGPELGQLTAAMFVGTRRFVVTGNLFTTGPEKLKNNELGLSGTVTMNGVDSVGVTLDVEGTFVGKCVSNVTGTPPRQDQLKPIVPPTCLVPDAGIRASSP